VRVEGGVYRGLVGVGGGHGSGGELVELAGGDALVDAGAYLLSEGRGHPG
jgi:hypothetical protein